MILSWRVSHALVLLFVVLLAGEISAQVAVPPLQARVTDSTGTLTAEQKASLEARLKSFEDAKGSQIAVLIVPTTKPEEIEQYSIRVAEAWQLGRKDSDDGVLLLVAKNDRAVRIEVGRGMEGALNDAVANRITDDIIVPYFRQGDFNGGISAGVGAMIKVIEGEPLPAPQRRQSPAGGFGGFQSALVLALIGAMVGGGFLRSALGRVPGAMAAGGGVGVLAWLLAGGLLIAGAAAVIAFVATLLGGGRGGRGWPGGWSGGYGQGGWGGGGGGGLGGGGGFGGGGGSFGGGGASGRW